MITETALAAAAVANPVAAYPITAAPDAAPRRLSGFGGLRRHLTVRSRFGFGYDASQPLAAFSPFAASQSGLDPAFRATSERPRPRARPAP